mgnify:FL=1
MKKVHIKLRWRGPGGSGFDTLCGKVVGFDAVTLSRAMFERHLDCPYCDPSILCQQCVALKESKP